jgi:methylase of polypeptide subunit release factors
MSFDAISAKMLEDWDARARENARYFIVNSQSEWSESEFYALGQMTLRDDILNDMYNVCQGKEPGEMRVLEICFGAGRVTRALAGQFGSVDAVDVSPEMVRWPSGRARTCRT